MAERYLPRWAKEEMNLLRRRLDQAETQVRDLQTALAGDGQSVFSFGHEMMGGVIHLPEAAHTLNVSLFDGFRLQLSTYGRGAGSLRQPGWLEVMVNSHHGMQIRPQSGNVIHIGPRES